MRLRADLSMFITLLTFLSATDALAEPLSASSMTWDAGKIFIQFALVTVGGATITACFQFLKDQEASRQTALSAMRDLIRNVDEMYLSQKQIKRMIRSHRIPKIFKVASKTNDNEDNNEGRKVDKVFLFERMDDLSEVQLALEQCSQMIRARNDLFARDRRDIIIDLISYSDEYLHDVVEDYEKTRFEVRGKICLFTSSCGNINDYLGPRRIFTSSISDVKERAKMELTTMVKAKLTEERCKAFSIVLDSRLDRHGFQ
jgi:hypothetical protein